MYPLDQMNQDRSSGLASGAVSVSCAVCARPMSRERREWQFRCSACGFRSATLSNGPDACDARQKIDEGVREDALEPLRRANFERALDVLSAHVELRGRKLLDVGCAHGWFLEAASRRGCVVSGIEPDTGMHAFAVDRGHTVLKGFFPDALPAGVGGYDVITFNDVFEHLPDVNTGLAACRERLREGGLLVLNLPDSRGAVFRAAALLDRLGIHGPLDRLWQKEYPSPHLSYFHPDCLAALAKRHGFRELHRGELATVGFRGLWQRLRYDRSSSLPAAFLSWVALALAFPVLGLLRSDISLQVFAKEA